MVRIARIDKIEAKLKAHPSEASFSDVRAVFEHHGWTLRSIVGSHHVFVNKQQGLTYSVPTVGGTKVKGVYLRQICNLLGL